jgi:methyl-accepting chemotaxis protein
MGPSKISYRISIPVILAAFFSIIAFIGLEYEKLDLTFYVLLVFVSIYVFFFGFATGQRFASPVKKLLERANELSKGNLSTRVYLETKDEIAELAKVFNKLAEELQESRTKEERAEKSVDIKVKAKTQELEETINALEQKVQNRTIELQKMLADLDKFKEDAKTKETEAIQLREEVSKLQKNSGRAVKKAPKSRKSGPSASGLKKIVGDLEELQKQTIEREKRTQELIGEIQKIKAKRK